MESDQQKQLLQEFVTPNCVWNQAGFLNFLVNVQERESMWKMMHKYIGADITSMVTLPVMIFEPMTMLQKMAEVFIP